MVGNTQTRWLIWPSQVGFKQSHLLKPWQCNRSCETKLSSAPLVLNYLFFLWDWQAIFKSVTEENSFRLWHRTNFFFVITGSKYVIANCNMFLYHFLCYCIKLLAHTPNLVLVSLLFFLAFLPLKNFALDTPAANCALQVPLLTE